MFKAALISSIFAAAAFQASADPAASQDLTHLPTDVAARVLHLQTFGERFEPAIQATLSEWSKRAHGYADIPHDLSALPADVAARVEQLQKHGERFAPAIRAILAEAAVPSWSFDGCGHEESDVALAMN